MQCKSLTKKCRSCGRENADRLEICPECKTDLHCGNGAVEGYTHCVNHGGPVPSRNFYGKGPMSSGSGSSFQLTRLAASYNKQVNDGAVLSNRVAIDLFDTRIKQLLERVDVNEAPDRVARLHEAWLDYRNQEAGTPEYFAARIYLDNLFEKIFHDYMAWNQIFNALELRGKAVEREVKTLKEIKAIMTAEDGYNLLAKALAATIKVIGDDPKKLKQVQYEFSRIIGESSDLASEADGEHDWGSSETSGGETGFGDVDKKELLYPGNQE